LPEYPYFRTPTRGLPFIKLGLPIKSGLSQDIPRTFPVGGRHCRRASELFEQHFRLRISRTVEFDARETMLILVCPGARRAGRVTASFGFSGTNDTHTYGWGDRAEQSMAEHGRAWQGTGAQSPKT
jgi:hypothetical protein